MATLSNSKVPQPNSKATLSSSPLLLLPGELRRQIWSLCAADGDWASLRQCCKSTNYEVGEFCSFPEADDVLDCVEFTIHHEEFVTRWIEVHCTWHQGRKRRQLRFPIHRFKCQSATDLMQIHHVRQIRINLVGPKACGGKHPFHVLYAKMQDIQMIVKGGRWNEYSPRLEGYASLLMDFQTEDGPSDILDSGRSFWESLYDDPFYWLLAPIRIYYYELFLPITTSGDTVQEFWNPAGATRIHLPASLKGSSSTLQGFSDGSSLVIDPFFPAPDNPQDNPDMQEEEVEEAQVVDPVAQLGVDAIETAVNGESDTAVSRFVNWVCAVSSSRAQPTINCHAARDLSMEVPAWCIFSLQESLEWTVSPLRHYWKSESESAKSLDSS